jgi:hypothetical protein
MAGSPKKRARRKHEQMIRNLPALIPDPPPEPEYTDRWGRKTTFRREYIDQARVLCEEGMTDKELARFFGVNKTTIYDWQFAHPEFAEAIKLGKEPANDRLERTAYEVAMGYSTTLTETKILRDKDGNEFASVVEREVVIPPNADMLRWMLKNRRPEKWKDKTEQAMTGEVVHLTFDQAKERLRARLEQLKLGTASKVEG